jgi:hypothetical protein
MATFGSIAAETDCCGNLYPLHVPASRPRSWKGNASLASLAVGLAARVVWTFALFCASAGLL